MVVIFGHLGVFYFFPPESVVGKSRIILDFCSRRDPRSHVYRSCSHIIFPPIIQHCSFKMSILAYSDVSLWTTDKGNRRIRAQVMELQFSSLENKCWHDPRSIILYEETSPLHLQQVEMPALLSFFCFGDALRFIYICKDNVIYTQYTHIVYTVIVPRDKSTANLCTVSWQDVKSTMYVMGFSQYSAIPAFYLLIVRDIESKNIYSRCLFSLMGK